MSTGVNASASSRLPQRTPKVPKNRTGVYVEMQNGPQKVPHQSIPPLARPRGVPASNYTNRYSKSLGQKQVVQSIRARQEWMGGFFPKPVKKSRSKQFSGKIDHRPLPRLLQGLPDYRALTRRSARNFVAASNDGVTHLEDLMSESMSSFSVRSITETIYDDISSIVGLEEVYKKVTKEEASTWSSSKERRARLNSEKKKQSPLTIRRLCNPQNPHPVIQYSDIRQLNSSSKNHFVSRPPVPAPFFYNSKKLPKAADCGGSLVYLSGLSGSRSSSHILAAPGTGLLTKSVLGFTREQDPTHCIEGQPPPTLSFREKVTELEDRIGTMGRSRGPSLGTTPGTPTPDLQKALAVEEVASINNYPVVLPDFHDEDADDDLTVKSIPCIDRRQSSPSMYSGIMLSLETDEGISKVIDLDEEEERNKQDVIEYRVAQRALQGITGDETTEEEPSDEVPRELDQLLHEHSEIVNEISKLQKLTCSDDEEAD